MNFLFLSYNATRSPDQAELEATAVARFFRHISQNVSVLPKLS